ncbi:hypothetical protein PIB30_042840 [Stylosanthes scabra]|uniref:Alkane hydroxylase MAH1-like n=1 Tax=Stylosanthes scabra TaxID=79078 RepID=A0ABU6WFP6_9FABA|nr:hypothetical protein [Stylosanthes scabra]
MAMLFLYVAIIVVSTFLILYYVHRRRIKDCGTPLGTDWPILGMLPQVLCNLSRIHDFATTVLREKGGTGEFLGPWFTNLNYMATIDPMNVHHMFSKNFDNYVKGPEFREMFNPFGDGLVTNDSETWRYHRTLLHSLFRKKSFETMSEKTIQNMVQNSLLPILDHACLHGKVLDIQQVFSRLMFEETCLLLLGYDPHNLSSDFPLAEVEKAFDEVQETIFYRHYVPRSVWKFQEWLQIGEEKKLTKACKVFDQFLYSCIARKRQGLLISKHNKSGDDVLSGILMSEEKGKMVHDDKFIRDVIFNLFAAGRDTITSGLVWFFWLVATHPSVEAKILEEIEKSFGVTDGENCKSLGIEDVEKLVYLHGALCEGLRLFPPIPIERKQPLKHDTLPSGHHVTPNTTILLFTYGPRTCLGKDVSFFQMKIVAAAVLSNYRIQVVENHPVIPVHSIILLMKHGLKVNISRRKL